MEETLIKAFNCADSLPRCCFIWHRGAGRAAPLPAARVGKGPGSSPPRARAPGPATAARRLLMCRGGLRGGREGGRERGAMCCLNNSKKPPQNPENPPRDLSRFKKLLNRWPRGPGAEEPSALHLAPAGLLNPPSRFVSLRMKTRTPGSCPGKGTCRRKSPTEN